MILDKIPFNTIIEKFILPKIILTYENLNFSNQQPLREFLKINTNTIFSKSTSNAIYNFPLAMLGDLENFAPRLKNLLGTRGGWIVKWNLWGIFSSITNKLLYFVYTKQWEVARSKILLSALQDCRKYFSQYFQLLQVNEEVRVKAEILQIYKYFIKVIKSISNDEKVLQDLKLKCQLIYRSWLSDREKLFRLKKQLNIPQEQTKFYIPIMPQNIPRIIDENIEGDYQLIYQNKPYVKVLYSMDVEDSSNREIDIIIKVGSAIKEIVEEMKNGIKSQGVSKDILNQSQFNCFIMKVAAEKYKILYDSFKEKYHKFSLKWDENQNSEEGLQKFIKSVKLAEDFMTECLYKYCSELEIYQKVFAIHIADISSIALSVYNPPGFKNFLKKLMIV